MKTSARYEGIGLIGRKKIEQLENAGLRLIKVQEQLRIRPCSCEALLAIERKRNAHLRQMAANLMVDKNVLLNRLKKLMAEKAREESIERKGSLCTK